MSQRRRRVPPATWPPDRSGGEMDRSIGTSFPFRSISARIAAAECIYQSDVDDWCEFDRTFASL